MSKLELCNDQKQQVRAFLRVVRSIKGKAIFRSGIFALFYHFKADAQSGVVTEHIVAPDDELLSSALIEVRKLIANGEMSNINRLHNLLYQKLDDESMKGVIGNLFKSYKAFLKNGPEGLTIGIDSKITGEIEHQSPTEALDLFINGIYFHEDEDKRKRLETDLRPLGSRCGSYSLLR